MTKQEEIDSVYMGTALLHARLSKAKRAKVGAVLVTKSGVTLTGYNGTPSGWDNVCEDNQNKTKPEVIHAELNCVLKAAKEGISVVDSVVYVTLSPCVPCAAMLAQAGIKELVYQKVYRDTIGLDLLERHGIVVRCLV